MTNNRNKRMTHQNAVYCSHCYVRLGIGERFIVSEGKIYHDACHVKLKVPNIPSVGPRRPADLKIRKTLSR